MIILLLVFSAIAFILQLRPLIRAKKRRELISVSVILTIDLVIASLMVLGVELPKISNVIFRLLPPP